MERPGARRPRRDDCPRPVEERESGKLLAVAETLKVAKGDPETWLQLAGFHQRMRLRFADAPPALRATFSSTRASCESCAAANRGAVSECPIYDSRSLYALLRNHVLQQWFCENVGWIRKRIELLGQLPADLALDDILQELQALLDLRFPIFDPVRGPFQNWAGVVVKSGISSQARALRRRVPLTVIPDEFTREYERSFSAESPERLVLIREELQETESATRRLFGIGAEELGKRLLDGGRRAVADGCGKPIKKVDRLLDKMRKELRATSFDRAEPSEQQNGIDGRSGNIDESDEEPDSKGN